LNVAYDAKILEVIIASPGDVPQERQIVREVITEWNAIYARAQQVVLLPTGWETHSSPELGDRPQQLINDRILAHADLLVGIFWTRVGSDTGKAISGSIEEIEEHLRLGKPVMLYFSGAPAVPDSIDPDQYAKLKKFKAWAKTQGLIESFTSPDDFRSKFRYQLPIKLQQNEYLRDLLTATPIEPAEPVPLPATARSGSISKDAVDLLKAAAADAHGTIIVRSHLGGTDIMVAGQRFNDPEDRRSVARWEDAVDQLYSVGFIKDETGKRQVYTVTTRGYQAIERLV
jgi:hypothetical protein